MPRAAQAGVLHDLKAYKDRSGRGGVPRHTALKQAVISSVQWKVQGGSPGCSVQWKVQREPRRHRGEEERSKGVTQTFPLIGCTCHITLAHRSADTLTLTGPLHPDYPCTIKSCAI